MARALYGIDLGTTYSAVALVTPDREPEIVLNEDGESITPSVVYFDPDSGSIIVGTEARRLSLKNPGASVALVKREMGKQPHEVRIDRYGDCHPYHFRSRHWSPEEISGIILRSLVASANKKTGLDVRDVVISVPAYFGSLERRATEEAGRLAGLNVHKIINEPTAVALVYGSLAAKSGERAMVFDLGGGTFDITTMVVEDRDEGREIKVLCTDGDRHLGGADWDEKIALWAIEEFNRVHHLNLLYEEGPERDEAQARLLMDAEAAKIALTTKVSTHLALSYGGQELKLLLDREKLLHLSASLMDRLRYYCDRVLSGAPVSSLDTLLLAGSMSRAPVVRSFVEEWFGRPAKVDAKIDPKCAVALGAAMHGWKYLDGPEEASPHGPRGEVRDVIPRSLGIVAFEQTGKPVVDILIRSQTTYPVEVSRQYGALREGTGEIAVRVVEGDSQDPDMNDQLGMIMLRPTRAMRTGDLLTVNFAYGNNGILKVSLKDELTGQLVEQAIERPLTQRPNLMI